MAEGQRRGQRWIVMYDGGSPGKKRLRHRFCPTGFPVHCALVRVSRFTRRHGGERISRCFAWSSRIMEESTSSRRNSAREGDNVTSVAGVRLVIT
jgi:hypothetical protein